MVNKSWLEIQNNKAAEFAYVAAVRAHDIDTAAKIEGANPQVDWASVKALIALQDYQTRHNVLNDNTEPPESI